MVLTSAAQYHRQHTVGDACEAQYHRQHTVGSTVPQTAYCGKHSTTDSILWACEAQYHRQHTVGSTVPQTAYCGKHSTTDSILWEAQYHRQHTVGSTVPQTAYCGKHSTTDSILWACEAQYHRQHTVGSTVPQTAYCGRAKYSATDSILWACEARKRCLAWFRTAPNFQGAYFSRIGVEPRKLSSAEFFNTVLMLTESLIRENCFREISENTNPRKLCASKIWRCAVYWLVVMTVNYS